MTNYNQIRANVSLIIENAAIAKHVSRNFKTTIFSVESIKARNALSILDKSAGVDQIHCYIDREYESFATSNRICFVKKNDQTKYFKIKYKRNNRRTEYDIWKIYNSDYFSTSDIHPIIPSYFIQSFVDLDLKYIIMDMLKEGKSVDDCIELIENNKTGFNIDDYIREIGYARINDLIDAIDSGLFKEKIVTEKNNNKLHWAYVDWMDVKDLCIIF